MSALCMLLRSFFFISDFILIYEFERMIHRDLLCIQARPPAHSFAIALPGL